MLPAACMLHRPPGKGATKGAKPHHASIHVIFLLLSKSAYTYFLSGPIFWGTSILGEISDTLESRNNDVLEFMCLAEILNSKGNENTCAIHLAGPKIEVDVFAIRVVIKRLQKTSRFYFI